MKPARLATLALTAILTAIVGLPDLADAQGRGESRTPTKAHVLQKLDRTLQNSVTSGAGSSTQRVIVRTRPGARGALLRILNARGGQVYGDHGLIEGVTADLSLDDVYVLAEDPAVLSISHDAFVYATGAPPRDRLERKGKLKGAGSLLTSHLREVLGLTSEMPTGAGVGVALIDSGIELSVDFHQRIVAFFDYTQGGIATPPYDDYGHGTHLAGLIASNGLTSRGEFMGVAPDARLIGLKVLDAEGRGRTSDVIAALEFATRNKDALGIDVINLSLGHPIFEPSATDPLVQAVEAAVRAGLAVVVSAGNFGRNPETGEIGYAGVTSPGNAPSAITAGALATHNTAARSDDRIPGYSSRGPTWYDGFIKPDLVAPGHRLTSNSARNGTLPARAPAGHFASGADGTFLELSGTSMAAGVTSGVVAVVLEGYRDSHRTGVIPGLSSGARGRNPHAGPPAEPLTPYVVKALLQYTAIKLTDDSGTPYDPLTQGAGSVNPVGALELARAIEPTSDLGTSWLTHGYEPYTTIDGETWAWSQNIVWGFNIVWGWSLDNIVWGFLFDNIVWGTSFDNIVWGFNFDNIVWGFNFDNIVWGFNLLWFENIVWGTDKLGYLEGENIVWGFFDNIVWGFWENIVWGFDFDNIVWGFLLDDNIVWGFFDNIVWGFDGFDNIVWGLSAPSEEGL